LKIPGIGDDGGVLFELLKLVHGGDWQSDRVKNANAIFDFLSSLTRTGNASTRKAVIAMLPTWSIRLCAGMSLAQSH
jgi:hypothetical protein